MLADVHVTPPRTDKKDIVTEDNTLQDLLSGIPNLGASMSEGSMKAAQEVPKNNSKGYS